MDRVGIRPICERCGRAKKAFGRDTGMKVNFLMCVPIDCDGYYDHPRPDDLWPGERASEFGYARELY